MDNGQAIPSSCPGAIDWSKQHCGVHQAPIRELVRLMPEILAALNDFPAQESDFTWDVKVHMLMPRQYPCIPNWHRDFVPREGGVQHPELASDLPMYMWLSGPPLTQFRNGFMRARTWLRFTANDEHRGTPSGDFCWRGMIRAAHKDLLPPKDGNWLRRHCQVYVDAADYNW